MKMKKMKITKERKHYEKSQHIDQEGNPPADVLQETPGLSVETTDLESIAVLFLEQFI